jgi:hypothetical protein
MSERLDGRITRVRGKRRPGPREAIGVLELRADGTYRAAFAERAEVDGRAHVQLARRAWGPKTSLDTRWWSLLLDRRGKVYTVRNGSCGDALLAADVPGIVRALRELDLLSAETMLHVDDGPAVFAAAIPASPV